MIYPFVENTLKNQGLLLKVPFLWWQLASKRPKKLLRFNSYKIRRQMKKKRKNMKNWENLNYKTQNDKFWTTHRLSLILKICFALKMLKVNKKYSNRSRTIKLTLRKHRYELLISIQSLGFFLLMNRIALSFSKTIICSTSCWMKRFLLSMTNTSISWLWKSFWKFRVLKRSDEKKIISSLMIKTNETLTIKRSRRSLMISDTLRQCNFFMMSMRINTSQGVLMESSAAKKP